jgi:small subunit ribosomal protein S4
MARYTDASCRLCRREGVKLYLKGDRCYKTDKCAFDKRPFAPGQHGQQKKKMSEYGVQLREKQKVRRHYGVLESQFRKYFSEAAKKRGETGVTLLQILERRLDNTVYRLGFAQSRPQARQVVRHGHILINGKKVDIPSYLIKSGDDISVVESAKNLTIIKDSVDKKAGSAIPKWLEVNSEALTGRVIALPAREDIDLAIEEHLIVELYSK